MDIKINNKDLVIDKGLYKIKITESNSGYPIVEIIENKKRLCYGLDKIDLVLIKGLLDKYE